jgi:hypothetical protein
MHTEGVVDPSDQGGEESERDVHSSQRLRFHWCGHEYVFRPAPARSGLSPVLQYIPCTCADACE